MKHVKISPKLNAVLCFEIHVCLVVEFHHKMNGMQYSYENCKLLKQTWIIAAGPALMPDIRKSSGSLSYGGSSYQWPIWCGRIDPLAAASSYMYVSSVEVKIKIWKNCEKTINGKKSTLWLWWFEGSHFERIKINVWTIFKLEFHQWISCMMNIWPILLASF